MAGIKKIREHFCEGIIWKQFIDPTSNTILLEVRNPDTRSLEFQVLDIHDLSLVNKFTPTQDDWWLKVEAFQDSLIYLTLFNENTPDTRGAYIYQVDGTCIFEKGDAHFQIEENSIQVKEDHDFQTIELIQPPLLSPTQYLPETEHFTSVSEFIQSEYKTSPIELIEYFEYDPYIFISFHRLYDTNKIENRMVILDDQGETIFQEKLSSNRKGVGSGTFFFYGENCYFVKGLNELKALSF